MCIHCKSHICKSLWIKASAKCKCASVRFPLIGIQWQGLVSSAAAESVESPAWHPSQAQVQIGLADHVWSTRATRKPKAVLCGALSTRKQNMNRFKDESSNNNNPPRQKLTPRSESLELQMVAVGGPLPVRQHWGCATSRIQLLCAEGSQISLLLRPFPFWKPVFKSNRACLFLMPCDLGFVCVVNCL